MESSSHKRIPGLDGLRAISILLVLCGHLSGVQGFYNNQAFWAHIGDIANLGVRIFFVISGYLITVLLLKEEAKSGTISIPNFYVRRTIRIFPASYCFLIIITALYYFHLLNLNSGDLLHGYTYTVNYFQGRSWWVGHLWSLSVEEQFYLLWPATLLLLGTRRGFYSAGAVILLAPVIRLATFWLWPAQIPSIGNTFQTTADTIATGCLLAGGGSYLLNKPWFRKLIDSKWFFLIPLAVIALNMRPGARLRWAVLETLINVGIALCVFRVTIHTKDWAGRALNWAPVVFLGTLSYSLYLWQQLFLNRRSTGWAEHFPQNVFFALSAAVTCHYCIEKPFLKLRDRNPKLTAARPIAPDLIASAPE